MITNNDEKSRNINFGPIIPLRNEHYGSQTVHTLHGTTYFDETRLIAPGKRGNASIYCADMKFLDLLEQPEGNIASLSPPLETTPISPYDWEKYDGKRRHDLDEVQIEELD